MGISRRAYAKQRGVSEMAVRKAIATGRITVLADGTIDPARADADWIAQTDPALQRGAQGVKKAVPVAALAAVRETLHEAGADPLPGETGGGEVSMMRARLANEVLKAQERKLKLAKHMVKSGKPLISQVFGRRKKPHRRKIVGLSNIGGAPRLRLSDSFESGFKKIP